MATTVDTLAAKSQANNDAAASALDSLYNQMMDVSKTMQKSAQEAAAAQEVVTTTTGLATQKAQKAALDNATNIGTNPEAANFILNKVAKEYEQNNARAQKFADNVAYASDITNITDNAQGSGSCSNNAANNSAASGAEHNPREPKPAKTNNPESVSGNQPNLLMLSNVLRSFSSERSPPANGK